MATAAKPVQKVLEQAAKFVVNHRGAWDHDAWEKLVTQVAKLGYEPDDEMKRNLGNILESARYLHQNGPTAAPKKKAAVKSGSRKKAAAKKR